MEYPITLRQFSAGESSVTINRVTDISSTDIHLLWNYKNDSGYMKLLMICDTIRYNHPDINIHLEVPYFPHSRMDRNTTNETPFSLKCGCDIIKLCNFKTITTLDIHSDVSRYLMGGTKYINQIPCLSFLSNYDVIICPDKGAIKRTKYYANRYNLEFVQMNKVRNPKTGQIEKTELVTGSNNSNDSINFINKKCIVVDDICDGGRTFIEISKVLNNIYHTIQLDLHVTFGIFSNGKDVLLKHYDNVTAETEFKTAQEFKLYEK